MPAPSNKSAASAALPVGYRLGEYAIEAVLGQGGFGITYRARDTRLGAQVAIKEYFPQVYAVRTEKSTIVPGPGIDVTMVAPKTPGHRLREVFTICDRVSALRDGRYIGTTPVAEATMDSVVQMMGVGDLAVAFFFSPAIYRRAAKVGATVTRSGFSRQLRHIDVFEIDGQPQRKGKLLQFVSGKAGPEARVYADAAQVKGKRRILFCFGQQQSEEQAVFAAAEADEHPIIRA